MTPPTNTGLSRATGVSAPVRPTCTSIASTRLVASSAGNLCATAKRGARATKPSRSCACECVHLVDDAVDVVRQRRALLADAAVVLEQSLEPAHDAALGGDAEAVRREIVEDLAVACRSRGAPSAAPDAVGVERELPRRRDAHVELPQRAGGGVARVDELALALLPLRVRSTRRKSRFSMSTSPRTSMQRRRLLRASLSGIARIVRRLAVTSSPV